MQTKIKRFMAFCEPCSFKRILSTNKPEDMILMKPTSPIQSNIPVLENGKTKKFADKPVRQNVKCPNCGRGIILRELPSVYEKSYEEIDKMQRDAKAAAEKKKRIEDGTPTKPNPDFLG